MGVNSYVTKPATFRELVELMDTLGKYWFERGRTAVDREGAMTHRVATERSHESCWSKTIPTTSG